MNSVESRERRSEGGSLGEMRPTLLLAAAKWWPLAARLAVALRDHGCDIVAVCPAHHSLCYVSGIRAVYPYRGRASLESLRHAMRESRADFVVPCDDGVVAQLHVLHARDPDLAALIERSLGPAPSYPIVRSRYRLLRLAADLGVRVPETREVLGEADLAAWHGDGGVPAVVKRDGENGGNGVVISRSLEESIAAYREFRSRPSALTAYKRLAIDLDALGLWRRSSPFEAGVTVQRFIEGRPANCMFACRGGTLLGVVSVIVVASEGPTGAATVVRIVRDEAMRAAAQTIAGNLGLTGFYGLDFIIDGSGAAYLIEMNPRCTQLGHLELPGIGSVAGVFAAALRGVACVPPGNPIQRDLIALFPQAQAAGPSCRPLIEASYHDVPVGEPELVRELLRVPQPRRHWRARLYHAFKRVNPAAPTLFEPSESLLGPAARLGGPPHRRALELT
ncbi:MAG TPA: ATP-grasp domain-containing protein [Steroidobacteraceae bacterium]|nr:ATP-grasp domain-containing protein [Steroidobacteraceae bacterium]